MLRSLKQQQQRQPKRVERAKTERPIERDLSISDPAGHRRYLGRPTYFGPLNPSSLEAFFAARANLERAEREGHEALEKALASYDLTSVEQWWHIEASFYQRHMIDITQRPRRRRTPHGTPAPELLAPTRSHILPSLCEEPPVSFEVFCEIAGAQAAWSNAGLDPALEASRHFLLELEELMAVELYWATELAKSRDLARQFARRMLEYKQRFSGG